MVKFRIYAIALMLIAPCCAANADDLAPSPPSHIQDLQNLNKQVSDEGAQLLQQQQALQDQIANLAKQRREIEDRQKELSRTMLEHAKRLEMQKQALDTLEQALKDERKSYAEQVKRFDDLRAQIDKGMTK
jgi:septal ring factor EnvC (AmiA/AmiB activator)